MKSIVKPHVHSGNWKARMIAVVEDLEIFIVVIFYSVKIIPELCNVAFPYSSDQISQTRKYLHAIDGRMNCTMIRYD